ncbi:DUF3088 domain-containing protein [Devosia psychrophila]|jgi:uracil-DNA glycosylase|uniref:DUF3088 domain-containing protein n=1 Tax=Devosia psychrophila TaxID=728005 RepID=A0A0F5PR54_9HYPH|nr:DUF3088 domain-containing protein [Devosia psychrophila]KKC31065.1 hypothetical protein WH91_21610 [Devosia psychrophila]SFD14346.1 Protein of unknown function [Devosia psychrophila]
MAKDKLYLIKPGFTDANRDDGPFVCPFCNQIEGLLASFPELAANIEVERVDFPRPRAAVIAAVGEANQGLPLLVFGDAPAEDAKRHGETAYLQDTNGILTWLAERHGFPKPHKFLG